MPNVSNIYAVPTSNRFAALTSSEEKVSDSKILETLQKNLNKQPAIQKTPKLKTQKIKKLTANESTWSWKKILSVGFLLLTIASSALSTRANTENIKETAFVIYPTYPTNMKTINLMTGEVSFANPLDLRQQLNDNFTCP